MALQRHYFIISSNAMQTPSKKLFINQVGEHDASSTVLHANTPQKTLYQPGW